MTDTNEETRRSRTLGLLIELAESGLADVRSAAVLLTVGQAKRLASVMPSFVSGWTPDGGWAAVRKLMGRPWSNVAAVSEDNTCGWVLELPISCEDAKRECDDTLRRRGLIPLDDLRSDAR